MKYLFIVQGEGRGHLTQALTLQNLLLQNGHEVVAILVGKSNARRIPDFFIRQVKASVKPFVSPNFLPTADNRRANIARSVWYNMQHVPSFFQSVMFIREQIRETGADMVVNFYELLTGMAYAFCPPHVPYICIGHQYLFLHEQFAFPRINRGNLFLLKFFTRMTSLRCQRRLALSFREMDDDEQAGVTVIPPLLRSEVLALKPQRRDYVLGYMVNSGYAQNVRDYHRRCPSINLLFFWDKKGAPKITCVDDTLSFHKVDDKSFLDMMSSCRAYATTGGFESVCEALYLGKPVLMVPAHIEQDCNAYDAAQMGAGVVSDDFNLDLLDAFEKTYKPNKSFVEWVRKSSYRVLPQLVPAVSTSHERITLPDWMVRLRGGLMELWRNNGVV